MKKREKKKKKTEEKERDLLKWELKNQMKTEQAPPSGSVKENYQKKDAAEEHVKEDKKADEQLSNSEKTRSKCAASREKNTHQAEKKICTLRNY